ncbi:MAG TPA: glutamate-5-semialdehyde dehydrogenase [Miltoncostaeales bacterium]|jgi:glutamate-5-semialdehyde dehydrogenase|nr:glutamate-5-semialdehyde dehydrogenase [Miltoncostaeales bacterium]
MSDDLNTLRRSIGEANAAASVLRTLKSSQKNVALHEMADALVRRTDEILRENAQDVSDAKAAHRPSAMVDRLLLDDDRIAAMAKGVRDVAALPDPIGAVDVGYRLPNGLEVIRKRVPLGVVAVIYEGRPNVTSDAAALCLKSGNAVVLRGSSIAARSNAIIADVLVRALMEAELPQASITAVHGDYDQLKALLQMSDLIDLVVPRGGEELKSFLMQHSKVPVIYAASGNNHVYVDAHADVDKAVKIAVNAKVHRPGVCNAAETLLVHAAVADQMLPALAGALTAQGVELRVSDDARAAIGESAAQLAAATDEDFATEYLDLTMAVKVVADLDEAIAHVERYGSGHSEAIVTEDLSAARRFEAGVDAACVYINASTRFTDGGEFGMGAEIANSTQKLHARGPIGVNELTSMKYVVTGDGHVRT